MSDEQTPWVAPGRSQPDSQPQQPPPPQYGEYAPPGWQSPAPPQTGWVAPPKPGLIPLRPLGLGDVTGGAFQVIRRNPKPTFGFALIISIAIGVLAAGIVGLVAWAVLGRIDMAASGDVEAIRAGGVLLVAVSAFIAALIQLALSALPQGVVAVEVARGALGERNSLRELWARVRPRLGALIGWTLLLGGALILIVLIVTLSLVQLAVSGGIRGTLAALGFGALIGLGVFALSVWLGTKLEFVPSLILIERLGIPAAMRRSWALTRGGFWRIFGITLLVNLIIQIAAQVITTPITVLGSLTGTLVNPNQTAAAVDATAIIVGIIALLVGIVLNAVIIVAQSAVPTLLYLDMRMRKEGFDLVLQRYVEEQAAGRAPSNPYESAPPPQTPDPLA